MADVTLTIGDRRHTVACPAGQEDQVRRLGTMLDAHWADASRASGGLDGERTMLFVALMLADSLNDAERRAPTEGGGSVHLDRVAARLEDLADALEKSARNA
ncbi:cell division protein ZapA [Sphingomonas immobilis]|uniref:Cell division protein ZapA n=1 Tax=Sphingomonas immobilis TaxID=3063997 RepID=A0ABT8ZY28_9SPHN|nr:cell division protein ZapA [Sphingomonas sp. CA1-15]MDO7842473.1 cell division protein ZapA [Sphingomonas sp. CA1-15]